jgi:hypothetical protein
MADCRACHQPIAIPHCESPTCTWCRACTDRKQQESKDADDKKGLGR